MKLLSKTINKKRLLVFSSILIAVMTITTLSILNTKAYVVRVDNKYIGQVKSKNIVHDTLEDIRKKAETQYSIEISVPNQISYKSIFFADRSKLLDGSLRNKIEDAISLTSKAFAISVDGKDIAFLKDRSSAEGVLNRIKAPYIQNGEDSSNIGFLENVNIVEKDVSPKELKEPEEILSKIILQSDEIKKYTIQKGDTISEIAAKYKLKTADIQKANPNIDVGKISIGQVLNLTVPRYVLNVKKVTYKISEEKIAFQVEYENTDELYSGDSRVKTKGTEGRKQINTELVSINGIFEESKIIGENDVLETPKSEIILKGTKERPRTVATGVFNKPGRGSITSRFGERWGRDHTGIDIGLPKGTPYQASDGGIVTFADWDGDYGKLVIIDHENGFSTYYGHSDTISVKKGQRVAKGDVIGTVGTTGRVTGPNLHFEVRKSGVPVDPLDYIQQ